jgi:hypothetical protein
MAFDLLFRRRTNRDWSRASSLVALPPQEQLPAPTRLANAVDAATKLNPNISIERRGRGGVVSKKWLW